jgi:hypothetical protein
MQFVLEDVNLMLQKMSSLFSFLYCRFFIIQFFLSRSQFLLHAIQEESLTTSQTAKIPVKEMAKRKRNNVMGGGEGYGGLLILLTCFSMPGNLGSHPCSQASRNAQKDLKTPSFLP